jgi:NitT/TauT family transport system ATP-binding protein
MGDRYDQEDSCNLIDPSSPQMPDGTLACRNIVFVWDSGGPREKRVLENVSLSVRSGEVVCIVGPTGCGKSTLLRIMMGLMSPTAGEVLIEGELMNAPDKRVGVMFQEHGLFPWLTVRQNVEFGLRMKGDSLADRQKVSRNVLEEVGLAGESDRYPHELSGGMKRRVSIARLLASDARYLLMDEPFEALDYETRLKMQEFLISVHLKFSNAILLVTHQVDEAILLSDRILLMSAKSKRFVRQLDINLMRPRDSASESFNEYRKTIFYHLKLEASESFLSER